MRRYSLLIGVAAVAVLCGGCASQGAMKVQPSSYRATLDTDVIAAVESAANVSGVRVVWVNPPRRAKTPKP